MRIFYKAFFRKVCRGMKRVRLLKGRLTEGEVTEGEATEGDVTDVVN